jgi:hypothetical protein
MELLQVRDGCEEVRVEISGCFSGPVVEQMKQTWESSQSHEFWRRFVVDISGLTGYDREGHRLLHDLHKHGALFAAGTAQSLDFLEEITSGTITRTVPFAVRRSPERASGPRPRHRAGIGTYEANLRYR